MSVHPSDSRGRPDSSPLRTQWAHPSLCGRWTIEEVAHVHNARRLAEHRGASPAQTLEQFCRIVSSTTAASRHTAARLGGVVVHAQDVCRPLGLPRVPPIEAVTEVARFLRSRDCTVTSPSISKGLRLEAMDGPSRPAQDPS